MPMKNSRGSATAGMKTFHMIVCPPVTALPKFVSTPGISRSAPSRKPMYQSGCEPLLTFSGLYGPNSQIGLICATVASTASAAKTNRNSDVVFIMKTGNIGAPTSTCSRSFLPGHWVCPWCQRIITCAVTSARRRPGISSTCTMYRRGMKSSPGY